VKTTLKLKPIPNGVFTSDQHAPSVRVDEGQPQEPEVLEVMEIDQQPEPNLEDSDWRFSILD
jgi:hypothetical protein